MAFLWSWRGPHVKLKSFALGPGSVLNACWCVRLLSFPKPEPGKGQAVLSMAGCRGGGVGYPDLQKGQAWWVLAAAHSSRVLPQPSAGRCHSLFIISSAWGLLPGGSCRLSLCIFHASRISYGFPLVGWLHPLFCT